MASVVIPPYPQRQVFHRIGSFLSFSKLGLQHMFDFYMLGGDLNSGPQTCRTCTHHTLLTLRERGRSRKGRKRERETERERKGEEKRENILCYIEKLVQRQPSCPPLLCVG